MGIGGDAMLTSKSYPLNRISHCSFQGEQSGREWASLYLTKKNRIHICVQTYLVPVTTNIEDSVS